MQGICLLSGGSNPELHNAIASNLSIDMCRMKLGRFSDGEVSVRIEDNIRGRDVFILQSICVSPNEYFMELLLIADAARRASAGRITAVIPYYGYARQDRRPRSERVPISARVVADAISKAGVNRLLTVDLHADQIQGFFDIAVDNVYSTGVLVDDLRKQSEEGSLTIVSPDIGGVLRARAFAKSMDDSDLAIIDKRRPEPNQSEVMNIIGDIKGRTCIIVDDMVDTAGTLCNAAQALKENGATRVIACIVHPVLSGDAVAKIMQSDLDSLVVTDTIPLSEAGKSCDKIHQLSLAPLLAESVKRVNTEESVTEIF